MNQDDIHTCHFECQRPICVAVREAVAAEREACAKEAESYVTMEGYGDEIAYNIRARGE
jgi:hypothetical protein